MKSRSRFNIVFSFIVIGIAVFGLWYFLAEQNAVNEYFRQFTNDQSYWAFVGKGYILNFGLPLIGLIGISLLPTIPKILFKIDNVLYNIFLVICALAFLIFLVVVIAGPVWKIGKHVGAFFLGIGTLIVGARLLIQFINITCFDVDGTSAFFGILLEVLMITIVLWCVGTTMWLFRQGGLFRILLGLFMALIAFALGVGGFGSFFMFKENLSNSNSNSNSNAGSMNSSANEQSKAENIKQEYHCTEVKVSCMVQRRYKDAWGSDVVDVRCEATYYFKNGYGSERTKSTFFVQTCYPNNYEYECLATAKSSSYSYMMSSFRE